MPHSKQPTSHSDDPLTASQANWFVYILECADGTLYTGIATDLDRRISEHNAGTGAKYTRARGPVELRYWEPHQDRSQASQREHQLKKLTRQQKQQLICSSQN